MIVLAFETSALDVSVALRIGDSVHLTTLKAAPAAPAGDRVLPAALELLANAGLALSALDGIGFAAGPGAFTGLRLGCAVAQGLGVALQRPLVAIGSLDALAAQAPAGNVVCALDARLGELYLGAFAHTPGQRPRALGPLQCVAADAVQPLGLAAWWGMGNGFALQAALPARVGGSALELQPQSMPQAREVALLAALALQAGEGIDAADAAPLYVRNKVAKTLAERAAEGLKA